MNLIRECGIWPGSGEAVSRRLGFKIRPRGPELDPPRVFPRARNKDLVARFHGPTGRVIVIARRQPARQIGRILKRHLRLIHLVGEVIAFRARNPHEASDIKPDAAHKRRLRLPLSGLDKDLAEPQAPVPVPAEQRPDHEFLPVQKRERLFVRVIGNREHGREKPDRPICCRNVEIQPSLRAVPQIAEMPLARQTDELAGDDLAVEDSPGIDASVIGGLRGIRRPPLSGAVALYLCHRHPSP